MTLATFGCVIKVQENALDLLREILSRLPVDVVIMSRAQNQPSVEE